MSSQLQTKSHSDGEESFWPTYLQRGPPIQSYMPAGSEVLHHAESNARAYQSAANQDKMKQEVPPQYQWHSFPPRPASAPSRRKRDTDRHKSPSLTRTSTMPNLNRLASSPERTPAEQRAHRRRVNEKFREDFYKMFDVPFPAAKPDKKGDELMQVAEHTGDTTETDSDMASTQDEKEWQNEFGPIATTEFDDIVLKPEPLPGLDQMPPQPVELDLEGDTLLDGDTEDESSHSRTSYGSTKRKAGHDLDDDHIRLFRPPPQRLKASPSPSPPLRDRSKLKDVMTASRKLLAVQKLDTQIGPRLPDAAPEPACKLSWYKCPMLSHFDLYDHFGSRTLSSPSAMRAEPAPPTCKIHPDRRDKRCHLRGHDRGWIHRCAHAARAVRNRLDELAGLTDGWIKEELRVCGKNFEVLLKEAWEVLWYCEVVGCQDNMQNDLDKENDPRLRKLMMKHRAWTGPMKVMQEGALLVPAIDRGSPKTPQAPMAKEQFEMYESPTQARLSRRTNQAPPTNAQATEATEAMARASMPPPPQPPARRAPAKTQPARPGTPIASSAARPTGGIASAAAEKKQRQRRSRTPHPDAFDDSTSPVFTTSETLRRDTILK